ncbi:MAG TPA: SHOCT domain-containing protein [Jiangellaceae bacterium]|jgi:type VI protein secretion system component VasK|nr:SHOCT domain-containing protein [Jiangellaceae bacterium]
MNDYPLLNLFWTMLWFFLFVAWIYLLIVVVTDIFRSDDLSGWAKALWVLFVIIVPWLGILVYLIARGGKMSARAASDYQRRDEEMKAYVREAAGTSGTSTADELTKLASLRDSGTITAEEFEQQKAKLLS